MAERQYREREEALRERRGRDAREQRQADELDEARHDTEKAREKAREREAWQER